jgi:hypothetical protein
MGYFTTISVFRLYGFGCRMINEKGISVGLKGRCLDICMEAWVKPRKLKTRYPLFRPRKPRLTAVRIRCADHATPSTRKSRHYFADSGGRSVGIVRLRTKAKGVFYMVTAAISQSVWRRSAWWTAEKSGFDPRPRLFSTEPRPALGLTQPSSQYVRRGTSPAGKVSWEWTWQLTIT